MIDVAYTMVQTRIYIEASEFKRFISEISDGKLVAKCDKRLEIMPVPGAMVKIDIRTLLSAFFNVDVISMALDETDKDTVVIRYT